MMALAGLHDVDWAKEEDAYGPASLVPKLLEDLASADPEIREDAFLELYDRVLHQGGVRPAAAKTVPFLLALLRLAEVEDKAWLLVLLYGMARCVTNRDETEGGFQMELARELQAGIPLFLDLLNNAVGAVRANAAMVLCTLRPVSNDWRQPIRDACRVEDPASCASLLVSLGELGVGLATEADKVFFEEMLRCDSVTIRGAAAIALARLGRIRDIPSRLPETVLSALTQTAKLSRQASPFQWYDGHIGALASEALGAYAEVDQTEAARCLEVALSLLRQFGRPERAVG